jgi:cobalt-zinc-cadmium efflux system outer membrane protein
LTGPGFQPQSNRSNSPIAILGPSLSATLPLFDQNQAQIAKAEIDVRRARKTYEAVERAVTQEVIGAIDQARTAWQLAALYRDRYLPLAERSLELSRESYQAGEAPFLSVLEAQQFLLGARRRHVEAVQAAAVTIPAIERTVGRPWHEMLGEKPATGEPTEPLSVDEGK